MKKFLILSVFGCFLATQAMADFPCAGSALLPPEQPGKKPDRVNVDFKVTTKPSGMVVGVSKTKGYEGMFNVKVNNGYVSISHTHAGETTSTFGPLNNTGVQLIVTKGAKITTVMCGIEE